MVDTDVIILGFVAGLGFGITGYVAKHGDEPFDVRKFGRRVVIFTAAGVLVAVSGEPLTQGNIVTATSTTAVLGYFFDELASRATRAAWS